MRTPPEVSFLHQMQFGNVSDEPLPPELRTYGMQLYRAVRTAYVEAGAPLGDSDEAMLVWFTFMQDEKSHIAIPRDGQARRDRASG